MDHIYSAPPLKLKAEVHAIYIYVYTPYVSIFDRTSGPFSRSSPWFFLDYIYSALPLKLKAEVHTVYVNV